MRLLITLGVLILIAAVGCSDSSRQSKREDLVVDVRTGDSEMNTAIAAAQASLTNFIAVFRAPQTNQKYFLIKGRFTAGDVVEHIWIADLTYDGTVFHGVIANEPASIPGLRFKQPVKVQIKDISDWMYVLDGKLIGGYTSRVLRRRMTEQERREQDDSLPYRYD